MLLPSLLDVVEDAAEAAVGDAAGAAGALEMELELELATAVAAVGTADAAEVVAGVAMAAERGGAVHRAGKRTTCVSALGNSGAKRRENEREGQWPWKHSKRERAPRACAPRLGPRVTPAPFAKD